MPKHTEITDIESLLKEKHRLKELIKESGNELNSKVKYLQNNLFDESVNAVFSGSKYGSWIPALLGSSKNSKDNSLMSSIFSGIGIFGKYALSKYSFKLITKLLRLFV